MSDMTSPDVEGITSGPRRTAQELPWWACGAFVWIVPAAGAAVALSEKFLCALLKDGASPPRRRFMKIT